MWSRPAPGKLVRLSKKQNKNKRAGGIVQGVEHLPTMNEALASISSTK
jgi:hypothetical protein